MPIATANVPIETARKRTAEVLGDWRGRGKIAVFAAGQHTSKILPVLEQYADRIAALIDDSPLRWGKQVGRWTVQSPVDGLTNEVKGILVSSDSQQDALADRLRCDYGRQCAILTLYPSAAEDPDAPRLVFTGERLTASSLEQIEIGHQARYYWALQHVSPGELVLDAACGNGYGSRILAVGGARVVAIDVAADAIAFAKHYYGHEQITHVVASLDDAGTEAVIQKHGPFDRVVSFETVEHVHDAARLIRAAFAGLKSGCMFLCSTPNGDQMPIADSKFHVKHHTVREMHDLLGETGFRSIEWFGQEGLQILKGRATERQRYCLYRALRP